MDALPAACEYQTLAALFILLLLAGPATAAAGDPTLLDEAYRRMYNLDFEQAHHLLSEWRQLHPDDPMGPVSDAAAYLYAEFDRLHILQSELFVEDDSFLKRKSQVPDPALKQKFLDALAEGQQLADKVLGRAPKDPNALLAASLRCGLRADYLALIEKRYLASLREVKAGRIVAERLLASHPDCYDGYIAAGIENYMLSLRPMPLRWLLRLGGAQTDRNEGLRKLRLTADKGRYFRPYARLLLAVAALRDRDRRRARDLLEELAREFPGNRLYAQELARLEQRSN